MRNLLIQKSYSLAKMSLPYKKLIIEIIIIIIKILSMSLKDFQILAKLGEGAFSTVYKVKRLVDNNEYAMKKVKMNNLTDKER